MSYRQVFDEAIGTTPPSTVDVDEVMRRQRRAARTRPALAAAAVAVVTAGVAVGVIGLDDEDPVAVPADALVGFPSYHQGTRVIAAESAPMADRSLTLTVTPTTLDLVLFSRCADHELADPNLGLRAELSVGEVTTDLSYCPTLSVNEGDWTNDEAAWWWDSDRKVWEVFWAATGIEVGEPVTITVTLTGVVPLAADIDEAPPLPSEGRFALAVAESVPFEEYPLPPRPDELTPLPESVGSGDVDLRADPTDPNRPVEATMAWDPSLASCGEPHGVYPLTLISQTPGSLRVLINDIEVAHHTWWDYEQAEGVGRLDELCREFADGEQVTVTVEPEHLSGDWRVRLDEDAGG